VGFAIGVAASVVAAIICALVARSFGYWRQKKGPLAGWWWQITYPPRHDTIIPGAQPTSMDVSTTESAGTANSLELGRVTDPAIRAEIELSVWSPPNLHSYPWSIELLHVRHKRDRLMIHCWRIFREPGHEPHYDRHWVSDCWIAPDSIVDGRYRDGDRNGEGGHGTFQLWRYSAKRYVGQFSESKIDMSADRVTTSNRFRDAPLEWISVGSDWEKKIFVWMKSANYSPDLGKKYWPRKVTHRLEYALGEREKFAWFAQLGMGTAIYDLTIPHALERLRRDRLKKRNTSDS